MDLMTIGEIEDVQSVSSPHEAELKELGKKWVSEFRDFGEKELDKFSRLIGAKKENLQIDEEWAITKEFFPGVNNHISYHYYGEEFKSVGEEDQLRFLFSGERVQDVTGEDLVGLIEIKFRYIDRYLSEKTAPKKESQKLQEKFQEPRREALKYLDFEDDETINDLASFLGSDLKQKESGVVLSKEFFPDVNIEVELGEGIDFIFDGENIVRFTNYELNSLGVYVLNHIIRYISNVCENKDLPEMCRKVFPHSSQE